LPKPDLVISSKGFCSAALKRRFPHAPLIYLPHSRIEPVEIDQMLPPTASWMQRKLACGISSAGERWSLLNAVTTVRFTAGNVADLRAYYQLPDRVRFDVIPAGIVGPASVAALAPHVGCGNHPRDIQRVRRGLKPVVAQRAGVF
jgi:hypothetical protein